MTNAEKYLKDGVSVEKLIATMENELPLSYVDAAQFWKKTIKPTLTEDERVILRNMQPQPTYITRDIDDDLTLRYDLTKGVRYSTIPEFNHLFQFIKERRRIRDSRIVRR